MNQHPGTNIASAAGSAAGAGGHGAAGGGPVVGGAGGAGGSGSGPPRLANSGKTSTAPGNGIPWGIYAAGAVVCAVLTGVAYLVGIQPAQARYAAHSKELTELRMRQVKATDLVRQFASAQESLEQTLKQVQGLRLRLDPATSVNSRLARLADLCGESGLAIDELQPGAAVDAPHYQTVPIRLVGTGSYTACATFLHDLRNRFPDTAVRAFESSNPNPGRNQATGTFRFELVWYTAPVQK
jgi:hypothetical protein